MGCFKEGNYKGTNQFSIQVLKKRGLTKDQINFLSADTSQNGLWMGMKISTQKILSSYLYSTIDDKKPTSSDHSIPPSQDVKEQRTTELIYTGKYQKQIEEDNTDQSYEINSLYDNNSYHGDTDSENQN